MWRLCIAGICYRVVSSISHIHLLSIVLSVWDGPIPGARCEVFISQIPRDAYEDLLIPLFSSVGPLWEFRLMMNFSGQNRGFAYAKYGSAAVANDAIHLLHGHMLEPGVFLSVRRSTEKRHLCLGNLPATTKQEDLLQVHMALMLGIAWQKHALSLLGTLNVHNFWYSKDFEPKTRCIARVRGRGGGREHLCSYRYVSTSTSWQVLVLYTEIHIWNQKNSGCLLPGAACAGWGSGEIVSEDRTGYRRGVSCCSLLVPSYCFRGQEDAGRRWVSPCWLWSNGACKRRCCS